MHYYKLESKIDDEKFLKGESVECAAVIPEEEFLSGKFKEGAGLVIMLSNRKKYMGEILGFTGEFKNGKRDGVLRIRKK